MSVKTIFFETKTQQITYKMVIAALKDFEAAKDRLSSARYRARQVKIAPSWVRELPAGAAAQELKDAQEAYDNLGGM